MDVYKDIKMGERGAWVSIIAYVLLSAVKLVIGYVAFSEALVADGLNNTTDIAASLAVLIGLKISRIPADADHPYGHFRAETIASLLASFIMAAVGIQVLISAGRSLLYGKEASPEMAAGWTALGCAVIMFVVYRYNYRLAGKIGSGALRAAAKDNLSDALVSVGAFVGIIGTRFGFSFLDPVAAFAVGLIICKTAWDIFRDASHSLTDGFDETNLQRYRQTIEAIAGVERISEVRARKHGNSVLVDVTIEVDPELNVVESHSITERIENVMYKEYKIPHVFVHIEPIVGRRDY